MYSTSGIGTLHDNYKALKRRHYLTFMRVALRRLLILCFFILSRRQVLIPIAWPWGRSIRGQKTEDD